MIIDVLNFRHIQRIYVKLFKSAEITAEAADRKQGNKYGWTYYICEYYCLFNVGWFVYKH